MAPRPFVQADYRDQAWMMDCLMYGYIPLEFREGLASETTDGSRSVEAREPGGLAAPTRQHWSVSALLMVVFLGGLGWVTVKTMAQLGEVLPLQAQSVVTELGSLTPWKY